MRLAPHPSRLGLALFTALDLSLDYRHVRRSEPWKTAAPLSRAARWTLRLSTLSVLLSGLLAQPAGADRFGPGQDLIPSHWSIPSTSAADIDGDGDQDVLLAGSQGLAWYENLDGLGSFGPSRHITGSAGNARSAVSTDMDGDGDQDVLSAGGSTVTWYENLDGHGRFGPVRSIAEDVASAQSAVSADIDGDGDQDVVSVAYYGDSVSWYENTSGLGDFGPEQIITTLADSAEDVFAADLDRDGDQDVLSASSGDDKIAWYENLDGLGSFGPQRIIVDSAYSAKAVIATDLDGDGDQDVLSAAYSTVAWYENTDGQGSFGPPQSIHDHASSASSIRSSDLDSDGDQDVVYTSWGDSTVVWHENLDGLGTFGPRRVISNTLSSARSVFTTDMNGDGNQDVLAAGSSKVAWFDNVDGVGTFGSRTIVTAQAVRPRSICAADLDGDGDEDVLSASYADDKIAWYENLDSHGTYGPQHIITTQAAGARSVCAADLDGDGDLDVLSASVFDDKIAWYENLDGCATFGQQRIISTQATSASSVFCADLDNDGDIDVLSASEWDDKIAWYENTDGLGSFSSELIITGLADAAQSVFSADLDCDGDMDVLSASYRDDKIAWYENVDGLGSFGSEQLITDQALGALSLFVADLDGDGDSDVLSASEWDGTIAWYENTNGAGSFGPPRAIDLWLQGARSVYAADLDNDGDQDVVAASSEHDWWGWRLSKVAWYANCGHGAFGPRQTITLNADGAQAVFSADLDGDGDRDVLSASEDDSRIVWYENAVSGSSYRNAGSNPASYTTATMPILGTIYSAVIDVGGTTGHSMAWLVGYATPDTVVLSGGQALLVNITDPAGELLMLSPQGAPIASFDIPLPLDPFLAGFEVSTQALHFAGGQQFALSNAVDLTLGY